MSKAELAKEGTGGKNQAEIDPSLYVERVTWMKVGCHGWVPTRREGSSAGAKKGRMQREGGGLKDKNEKKVGETRN